MKNVGLRIKTKIERIDSSIIQSFKNIPVANIADNMNRAFCIGASRLKPLNDVPLLGTAFTVKARPGDNLMLNKAIDMAQPGDVIVVEGQGDSKNALMGELMVRWAKNKGVVGFVIDGAIRDYKYISENSLPVYATDITPAGPYKNGPGEINFPISIQGVVVNPGDLIIGDQDGIVVINPSDAESILFASQKTVEKEKDILHSIELTQWDRRWVDEVLKANHCEFINS